MSNAQRMYIRNRCEGGELLSPIPRIEESQVPRHRFHSLERVSLEHLRKVRVPGKRLSPCHVIIWRLPLSIVYERVAARNLIQKNIPGSLGDDMVDRPSGCFLYVVICLAGLS
jgi:hypothetical protein